MRADKDNNDVIESYSLYYIFSVFPSFVYYYITNDTNNITFWDCSRVLEKCNCYLP